MEVRFVIESCLADAHVANPSIASGLAMAKLSVVATAADTLTVAVAVQSGDPERIAEASTAAIGSIALSTLGAIAVGVAGHDYCREFL